MKEIPLQAPLNNVQLEILNLFKRDLPEKNLIEIKRLLTKYLAKQLAEMADQDWEENSWTNEDMDRLANTHLRTPYKP